MRSVLILCAATWGELGNLNAANRLAEVIRQRAGAGTHVAIQPAEEWCEAIASSGRRIRALASGSQSPDQRGARYLALVDALQARFPPGFETDEDFADAECDLDAMGARIAAANPDLVIGTKGLLSRIAQGAVRRRRLACPVVNYVTNDGLLTLPLHHTGPDQLNLVQTGFGRRMLGRSEGVEIVGPLVGRGEAQARIGDPDPRPLVALLCNRNGEYRPIVELLARRGEAVRVRAIIMGAPDLLAHARRIAPAHWDLWDARAAREYLALLDQVAMARSPLLLCKSGPNTVLEAAAAGVPVLAIASGLPTERWIGDLVAERSLGWTVGSVAAAAERLDALLDAPGPIAAQRANVRAFAEATIGNERNGDAIFAALRRAIATSAAERAA